MKKRLNIVANMSTLIRTEQFEGEDHFVLPTVLLKEGVLNNLFYPAAEVEKFPQAWNGIPIPVFHPSKSGNPFTANNPKVIEEQSIGRMFNCFCDNGKLKGEAWINKAKVTEISPDLLAMIENGDNIEVSTGLFTEHDAIGGIYNGKSFNSSVFNYRPDHLAVLPGGVGAMNWEDGAGMPRTNEKKKTEKEEENELMDIRKMAKLLASNEISHDELWGDLNKLIGDIVGSTAYVIDVFDNYFIYSVDSADGLKRYKRNYTKTDTTVTLAMPEVLVEREVSYVPVINEDKKKPSDVSKDQSTATNKQEGSSMDRTKLIEALITNSDWSEDDKERLMKLNDEEFAKVPLQKPVEVNEDDDKKEKVPVVKPVEETPKVNDDEKVEKVTKTEEEVPKVNDEKETMQDILNNIKSPELKATLNRAVARDKTIKDGMIKSLVDNESCSFTKEELETNSIDELEKFMKLAGSSKAPEDFSARMPAENEDTENMAAPAMPTLFSDNK